MGVALGNAVTDAEQQIAIARLGQARQTASSPGDRTIVLCPLRRLYVSAVSSGIRDAQRRRRERGGA